MEATRVRRWFPVVAIFGSLALTFAHLEIAVRVWDRLSRVYPLTYYDTEDPAVTLWCYDEGFRGIVDHDLRTATPYRSIRYHGTEGLGPGLEGVSHLEVPMAVEVRLNANGFRERPFEVLERLRSLTLVVGDSFCFGQGVRVADRLTERLESRGAGTFANLCRASANLEEIAGILESGLDALPNAAAVVYVYNLNDPVRDESVEASQPYIDDFMHLRGYNVIRMLPPRFRILGRSALLRWGLRRVYGSRVHAETETWYRRLYEDGPGWEASAAILRRMNETCRRRGIPFEMVIFPVLHDLDRYPFRAVHAKIADFGASSGFPVVDLLPAFEGRNEEDLQVHPTDFHPNHLGHEVAARFLSARLAGER